MLRTVWVGILAFLADRVSKQLVMDGLQASASKTIWKGVLDIVYTQNTGMAFSILANRTWLLIALSIVALILMVLALKSALPGTRTHNVLLWLLLAGGLGNLLDRLLFGYVVDFVQIRLFRFPVFNIADICLTVSAVLLIVALFRHPKETESEQKSA